MIRIRRTILWTVNTVESFAVLAVGACALVRGFILDEPKRMTRDPFTGDPVPPERRPN